MFKRRNLPRLMGFLMVVLGLAIIVAFTPAIPWLKGALLPGVETPPPTTPPAESPAAPPASETEEPPGGTPEVSEFKTLIFTEEEINSLLSQATSLVAESGIPANVDYVRARLVEDKMLLSVSVEASGIKLGAEDIEVCFQGTEVSASGEANISSLPIDFSFKANMSLRNGKLAIDIETIDMGIVTSLVPQLQKENLNQYLNQKLTENPFPLPLSELEEITVEDGELVIKGR